MNHIFLNIGFKHTNEVNLNPMVIVNCASFLLNVTWSANTFMIYSKGVSFMGSMYLFKTTALQGLGYLNDLSLKKMKLIMMLNAPLTHWMNTYPMISINILTRVNRYINWHMKIKWIITITALKVQCRHIVLRYLKVNYPWIQHLTRFYNNLIDITMDRISSMPIF